MIRIENLYFSYNGAFGLHDVNLRISSGEVVTLLGPNGSGKTTLLKNMYGILKPDSGCIYVDGKKLDDFSQSDLARTIGDVPQDHYLTFPYKVIDIVVIGRTPYLSIFSSPSRQDYEDSERILDDLGILRLSQRPYTQVSGGERQLVFIASALMQNPKALLLDEPTMHLDLKHRVKVLNAVRRVAAEKKLAVLMTLHEPNDAIMFSDKVTLMKDGRIVNYGCPDTIINEENLGKVYGMSFSILRQDNARAVVYQPE